MSKQLDSILSKVPSATVRGEHHVTDLTDFKNANVLVKRERIVASIPIELEEEIRSYIKKTNGETEQTIVLKALKAFGFSVHDHWLQDRRSLRGKSRV